MRVEYTSEPYTFGASQPAEGVLVSVCYQATKLLVPIYRDGDSADRALNPLLTEFDGTVSFWIESGYYSLVAQGLSTDIVAGDPESNPIPGASVVVVGSTVFIVGPQGPLGLTGPRGAAGPTSVPGFYHGVGPPSGDHGWVAESLYLDISNFDLYRVEG